MCGISGYIDFKKRTPLESLVDMTNSLEHRGPDGGKDGAAAGSTLGEAEEEQRDLREVLHRPVRRALHLQELDAVEHLDTRNPRIAGLGHDDIVLPLGSHQCPIGISAPNLHFRVF